MIPSSVIDAVQPWADLYANSPKLAIGITFLHLAAMMVGGGAAIAADWRFILGGAESRRADASALASAHRVVIPSFVIITITGIAMAMSDLEMFSHSGVFGAKLLLSALLAANGGVLVAAGRRGHEHGKRLARASAVSVVLWLATLLVGCWLQVA